MGLTYNEFTQNLYLAMQKNSSFMALTESSNTVKDFYDELSLICNGSPPKPSPLSNEEVLIEILVKLGLETEEWKILYDEKVSEILHEQEIY